MKNLGRTRFFRWLSGGFLIVAFGTPARADVEVKMVGDPLCPVSCSVEAEAPGYFVEILRTLVEGNGFSIVYANAPWSRAHVETRQNLAQGVAGALKTDAPDFLFPKYPFGKQKSCFYTRTDRTWKFEGIESLMKIKLGATKDYSYGEMLDSYIAAHSKQIGFISGNDTALRSLEKLLAERIDVFVEDETIVNYILGKQMTEAKNQVNQVGCLSAIPLYVAFSPRFIESKKTSN